MKHVVITGGSRGIGAAAVRLFAARGERVWFFYEKSRDEAEALARETGAEPVCCDVADEAAVARAFGRIPDTDVLVLCAGIAHYGLISQITPVRRSHMGVSENRYMSSLAVRPSRPGIRAVVPSLLSTANAPA